MNFPNLPGNAHANTRANLERACEELRYYAGKVCESLKVPTHQQHEFVDRSSELLTKIENATPETANELFKQARQMCLDMEKILCSK